MIARFHGQGVRKPTSTLIQITKHFSIGQGLLSERKRDHESEGDLMSADVWFANAAAERTGGLNPARYVAPVICYRDPADVRTIRQSH